MDFGEVAMKVWVWLGDTSGYEAEDLDILCLQIDRDNYVYVMESGNYEFETKDQTPGEIAKLCSEADDWWLVSSVKR